MDQTLSSRAAESLSRQKVTDIVVVTAMAVVALAISVAVSVHFGVPASRASVAGILIFALLVGAHFLLVPRATNAKELTELEDEELWNALKEQRRNAPDAKRMAMATRADFEEPTSASDEDDQHYAAPTSHSTGVETPEAPAVVTPPVAHVPRRKPRIVTQTTSQDDAHSVATQSAEDEHESFWSYRPHSDALSGAEDIGTGSQTSAPPALPDIPISSVAIPSQGGDESFASDDIVGAGTKGAHDGNGDRTAHSIRESDVELVQSMIKKLALEVNAAEVLEKKPSTGTADVAKAGSGHRGQVASVQPPELPPELPSHAPEIIAQSAPPKSQDVPIPPSSPATVDLVTESVDALRSTAEVMREADDAAPDDAPQMDQPVRPVRQPDAEQIASAISAALDAGQIGVLLEPIVTLNDMRPDHYEVRLQVRAPQGGDLDSADVERDLQATGVLAEVDRERFIKTLSVGELLHERGKAGSLLTRVYRESLLDRDFCFAVATSGVANETLARHMVLTLTQDTVRGLTASEWQTLSEFRELGYRFAISHVNDLDMDFAQLTAAGFSFVKLNADTFLGNILNDDGAITPKDLARYLAQSGLTLIIEDLADSARAAEALEMGAGLGQGPITGGPRLMKAEAIAGDRHAVA